MDFSKYQTMDPDLLLGLVNTELRNHSKDLDDLCRTHNLDEKLLIECLGMGGYEWKEEQNQFR